MPPRFRLPSRANAPRGIKPLGVPLLLRGRVCHEEKTEGSARLAFSLDLSDITELNCLSERCGIVHGCLYNLTHL